MSGILKVGFDVTNHPEVIKAMQGVQSAYELLIGSVSKATSDLNTASTGWDGIKQKLTETGAVAKTVGSEVQTSMIGRFKDGILQLNNIDTTKLNTGVKSATEKFQALGSAVVSNATSFGIFSASAFGVINTISNLQKQEVLLEQRHLRLQTATTQLQAAELALATAKESGTASTERIALLEQRVTDARTRLGVETAKLEVAQGDYNTSLQSFAAQILPLVVNVGASGVQAFTGLSKAIKENKISFSDIRTVITGVFEKIGLIPNSFQRASQSVSIFSKESGNATKNAGGLRGAIQGLGVAGIAAGAGVAILGGFLIALGLDVYNTQKRVSDLKAEFTTLPKNSEAAFRNMAEQAATFNKSLVGQIGGFLASSNTTIFGTKPVIGFNFREVFKNRFQEDVSNIRADLVKGWNETMQSPEMQGIGLLPDATQQKITANMQKIMDFIITDVNWQDDAHAMTTLNVAQPIAAGVTAALQNIPNMIFPSGGAKGKVDLGGFFLEQFNKDTQAAILVADQLKSTFQSGALPASELGEAVAFTTAMLVKARPEFAGREEQISRIAQDLITKSIPSEDAYQKALEKTIDRDKALAKADVENRIKQEERRKGIEDLVRTYGGLNEAQGANLTQMESFAMTMDSLLKPVNDLIIANQRRYDTEVIATEATFRTVDALFDQAEASVNLNRINDGTITSHIKMRDAVLQGLTAAEEFITTTKLQHETTETMNFALLDYVTNVDKIKIPSFLSPTTELLQQLHTEFINTGSAAIALSDAIDQQLASSFETFNEVLSAKSWKEFKEGWKSLEFGNAPKNFVEGLRDAANEARKFTEKGRELKVVTDGIIAFGKELSKKELRQGVEFLSEGIGKLDKNLPGGNQLDPIVNFLDNLSAKDRQAAITDLKDTLDLLWEKTRDGELSVEDADAALAQFNIDMRESGRLTEDMKKDIEIVNKTFKNFAQGGIQEAIQSLKDFGAEFESQADLADLRSGKKVLPPLPGTVTGKQPKRDIVPQFRGDEGASQLVTSVNQAKTELAKLKAEAAKPLSLGPLNIDQFLLRIVDAGKGVDLFVQFMAKIKTTLPPPDTSVFGNRVLDAAKGVVAFVKFVDAAKSTVPAPNTKVFGDRLLDAAKGVVAFVKFVNNAKSTIPAPNISGVISAANKAKSALNSIPKTINVTIKAKRVGNFDRVQQGGVSIIDKDSFIRAGEGNRRELHMFFPLDAQAIHRANTDFTLRLPKIDIPRIPRIQTQQERIIRIEKEPRSIGGREFLVPVTIVLDMGREFGVIRKQTVIRIGDRDIA